MSSSSIFSTYVEVFPPDDMIERLLADFLHVCGGVSFAQLTPNIYPAFSPRMWRCF